MDYCTAIEYETLTFIFSFLKIFPEGILVKTFMDRTELEELYLELDDLLRYSEDDDPTADQAVVKSLIRDIIDDYYEEVRV